MGSFALRCGTAETCLQSVDCRNSQNSPKCHSTCPFSCFCRTKRTLRVVEEFRLNLAEDVWEKPCILRIVQVVIPVHKRASSSTMSVQVSEEDNWPLAVELFNHLLYGDNLREKRWVWLLIDSVQVDATETAPVVAMNYPVDVDHWNYLEHKVLTEKFRFFIVTDKEVYYALTYMRAV